jgi:outer membrane lipoprotein carrier protein
MHRAMRPSHRPSSLWSALVLVLVVGAATFAMPGRADADPPAPAPAPSPVGNGATPAPQSQTDALVGKVQGFYDKSTSFQSPFSQEFWVKAYNQKKTSRGTVVFQKPGKMQWVYDDPKDNRIVSDGSTLRVYEAANKQMYEQQVDKSQYPAALSFLTGQGKLTDHFDFQMFPGESMNFPGGSVLVGNPKTPTAAYQKVLFYVDNATSQVRRVMILDGQGNRNRFDFLDPKVNQPVKPEQFRFDPPPGTAIIHP